MGTWRVIGLVLAAGAAAQPLPPGEQRHGAFKAAGTQSWRISAERGQYVRVLLQPRGSFLSLRLSAPSGAELATSETSGGQRAVPVSAVATESGEQLLQVTAASVEGRLPGYDLTLSAPHLATPEDERRAAAERSTANALRWKKEGSKESTQKAIHELEGVLEAYRALADKSEEGQALGAMGEAYWSLGDAAKAAELHTQAAAIAHQAGDVDGEANALSNLGGAVSLRDPRAAAGYLEDALKLCRQAKDLDLEGTTLGNLGSVYQLLGNSLKALGYATRALEVKRQTGDRLGAATALANVGAASAIMGEPHRAIEAFTEVLAIRRALHDARGEAYAQYYLATTYTQLGEPDKALSAYREALPLIRAVGDRRLEARMLSNLSVAQTSLGAPQEGLAAGQQAVALAREISDRHVEAAALNNLARGYLQLGDAPTALDFTAQALAIQRETSDPRGQASALASQGSVRAYLGERAGALESYQEALVLARTSSDRANESDLLDNIAQLMLEDGDLRGALPLFERSLALAKEVDDRHRIAVASIRLGSAYVERDRIKARDVLVEGLRLLTGLRDRVEQTKGLYALAKLDAREFEWAKAREHLRQALQLDEEIRAALVGRELRASYFATVADQYELLVDVLMHMHVQEPKRGYDVEAFETSERARARSLLDLLADASLRTRRNVDPALLERERVLVAQLHAKTERQVQLLSKRDEQKAGEVEGEIRVLTRQYRELEGTLAAKNPRYAAFAQSAPLSLKDIQRTLLDPDTLLWEVALGADRSFAWAVTPTVFHAYPLPPRRVLEDMARRAYDGSRSSDPEASRAGALALQELGHALLDPIAADLGSKRLLIITEGALQYVPFAALPSPGGERPLVVDHELVMLPSASTPAFIRRQARQRAHPTGTLAVLADPVFTADDPRVTRDADAGQAALSASAERSASGFQRTHFERLPSTRKEALEILSLVPPEQRFSALDFEANRAAVTGGGVSGYRFLHIASHGLLNSLHPELSSVVLSQVDPGGKGQDGFLQATDVYNLELGAELVVLSACETALGQEIRGEGLVGLTRAFMFAGSSGVVASLWTVPDVSTAELMSRFYRAMLVEGLRPPAALRKAQVSLWQEGRWSRPYYWAAFTLQGEWK